VTETRTLRWTYELPAVGDGATGLEDYGTVDAEENFVGKVSAVLRRDDMLYVAVEAGTPPLKRDMVVVPWDSVRDVDHSSLTVRLALGPEDVARAPRLDPSRSVRQGEFEEDRQEEAEAVRVTEVPGAASAPPDAPGPVDRGGYAVAVGAGILGMFGLLLFAILASLADELTWHFALLVIPGALLLFAAVMAYRVFQNPVER
jgi:hypothetical protein